MNVYIRGKKIKIKGGKVIARFKKRGLFSDKYDLYDGNGNFVLCMIKEPYGLAASDDFEGNNIIFALSQTKSVQIGLGPRFLSKPLLPLYETGVGAYSGESTYGSLILKGKKLYLDNNLIAEFHIHGGFPIFRPGFTCLAVLWILRSCQNFYLRDSHTLWLAFPCHSVNSSSPKSSPYPERISPLGLPSSAFARHYLRNLVWCLFLALLRCFSSGGSLPIPMDSVLDNGVWTPLGCPIQISPDQWMFAPPRSFSQLTTSFIGSQCQGIHLAPFLAWPFSQLILHLPTRFFTAWWNCSLTLSVS